MPTTTLTANLIVSIAFLTCEQGFGQTLDAEKLFQADHIVDVKIEMAQEDWQTLCRQSRDFADALSKTLPERPFTYFRGSVTIDGVRVDDVGIRKKGFLGSLDARRPSLKIKFGEYKKQSPVKGLDRLTLNNNKQDRSLVSQYLTYKLFRDAGLPACRCNHARVTVNGKYLGIYSHVESIKKPFLKRSFGSDKGDLYEGTIADFFPNYVTKFEAKTKKPERDHLMKIAKLLEQDVVDLEELGTLVDIDQFLTFWALESLVGFWDGYTFNQNNYFIYRRPDNGKLNFLPWGTDSSFTDRMPIPPYFVKVKSVHTQALLANQLYLQPGIPERYKKTLDGLLDSVWNEEKIVAELSTVGERLKPHLDSTQRDQPRALEAVKSFVIKRREVLNCEFEKWPIELTHGARRPIYFKETGTAVGTFSTTWDDKTPADPYKNGTAQLTLVMDGKNVEFKQIGIHSEPSKGPGQRDSSGQKPPTIVFTALRKSDNKQFVVAFGMESKEFKTSEKPVQVGGVLIEGKFGFLNPKGMKMMSGTATLKTAERKAGAKVEGTMKLQIVRMAGGEAPYIRSKRRKNTEDKNADKK